MDDRLMFHLLLATLFLILGIRAGVIFLRWHTKYNLSMLIILTILFLDTIFHYLYPGRLISIGGIEVQILLAVIFVVLLNVFLFYPEVKGILNRRKTKNK